MKLSETPMCEPCMRRGIVAIAMLVDHKHEISDGGAPLDYDNLESMCRACHERKTKAKKRERDADTVQPPDCPEQTPWS